MLAAAVPSAGQWAEYGTQICNDPEDQRDMDIVRLENGLTVVVWNDNRGSGTSIYAQCFDPSGNMLWPMNGAPVCTLSSTKYYPQMTADGAEGVIITWGDDRSGDQDIYAQRLDADGGTLWGSGGVTICGAANNQGGQKLVSDGYGGAIITWHDERYGVADHDLFAQRVDATGSVQWTVDGINLSSLSWSQHSPEIVTDGDHGAVIAWHDNTENDIYAQRVGNNGVVQWPDGGSLQHLSMRRSRPATSPLNGTAAVQAEEVSPAALLTARRPRVVYTSTGSQLETSWRRRR